MALALVSGQAAPPDPLTGPMARLRLFAGDCGAALPGLAPAGCEVRVDRVRLSAAWLDWRREMPRHPPQDAAGVLFACLLRHMPVRVARSAADAHPWPEGRLTARYCLGYRRRLLGVDDPPGPVLDDADAWAGFRARFTGDPATGSAVGFLERCAGEGDAAAHAAGPRPVHTHPLLPAGTTRAIFELATLTNSDDLWAEALADLLARYGAALPLPEVRRRFLLQPPALIATHVALATGQVCPGSLPAALAREWAGRAGTELRPAPGAADLLARLAAHGIAALILAPEALGAAAHAIVAGFPGVSVGVDPARDLRPGGVLVTASPVSAGTASVAGFPVLGIAADTATRRALRDAGASGVAADCAEMLASLGPVPAPSEP